MKFNEFKPQLTEEQVAEDMLRNFLEGKISKEEMVNYINENQLDEGWWDKLSKLGGIGKTLGSKLYDKGKGLFKGKPKQGSLDLKGGAGKKPPSTLSDPNKVGPGKLARPPLGTPGPKGKPKWIVPAAGVTAGVAGVAAIDALSGDNKNDADASPGKGRTITTNPGDGPPTPKAPKPGGEQSFGQAFSAARKAQGGPGGKFSYKGKEYQTNIKGEKYAKNPTAVGPNKTLALQQRLKAAGADIKADGLMGPNTRAAMKKYGIGQSKPAAPAPAPARPSTPVQSGGAGGEFAAPARPSTPTQSPMQKWTDELDAEKRKPKPRPTGRLPKSQPGTMSV
jgi:hypothetical protein